MGEVDEALEAEREAAALGARLPKAPRGVFVERGEANQLLKRRGIVELERCRRSPLYWAERYCWTRDEKDTHRTWKPLIGGKRAVHPVTLQVRPLEDSTDDYLRWLTLCWTLFPLIITPKSRQLRLSWWAMSMCTWLAQFRKAQRVAVQSKQLGDADKMLDRAQVILELQPKVCAWIPWPKWYKKFGLVKVYHGGAARRSRIEALAQGGGKIRGEAYSQVFSDEGAFQPDAEEAFTATMPLIEGGCRYLGVSSALGGTFYELLCKDAIR